MKKPQDIASLDKKIDVFKKKRTAKQAQSVREDSHQNAAKGFQMSIELIAGVFIGFCIGYFLDLLFQTKPWLLAVFTVLGGAAGILNIYK
jgi:ATP synthase protein I